MSTVLLVDDDATHTRRVRKILRSAGYRVLEASALDEVEPLVAERTPDLLVLDLFVPDRLSLMLIRRLRKQYPDMQIIAMTGESGITKTDYHRLAMDCGAVGVLTKPFSKIDLISMVKDALGES